MIGRLLVAMVVVMTWCLTPTGAAQAVERVAQPMWVFFCDKGTDQVEQALDDLSANYNQRAIARRQLRRTAPGMFDERDLPVAEAYVDQVLATGAALRIKSNWLNAISVMATDDQSARIESLPITRAVQPVARRRADRSAEPQPLENGGVAGTSPYGFAEGQLAQINLINLHAAGYTGEGVVIGVLDTGFNLIHEAFNHPDHPLSVIAEHDFINDDSEAGIEKGDPENQHKHGTWILGTMGAYMPDDLLGGAYDAAFILCKTEDTSDETQIEEDYYVAGLEFIEANGGDVATSSLSYFDWYTPEDMDGVTAVTSIGVNIATANGVYCCTAAGNSGHDDDIGTWSLGAPADALQVITCGSVNAFGEISGFSSDGPTADGRVKPEVLAQGEETATVHSTDETGYSALNGTSLSTPLVAGAVACLVEAHPEWTVDQMREALFANADYFGEFEDYDPLYVKGYGILDVVAAEQHFAIAADLDGDGTVGAADLAILLGAWGPCPAGACPGDLDGDGAVGAGDLAILLGAWG